MKIQSTIVKAVLYSSAIVSLFSCAGKKQADDKSVKNANPESVEALTAKIAADPKDANLYYLRAKAYVDKRDMPMAYTDIAKALSIDSLKPNYYLTLSDVYFSSVQTRKAKAALEKCISLDKNNVDANLKMAELLMYVKENEQSITYVDKVLKLDVHNPKAYFIKGMNFKELKDTNKAISSFQTVVEQNPDYYNAYMQLAVLYGRKKNPIALQYISTALKLNPKSIEALYTRAMFFQSIRKFADAKQNYKLILTIDPAYKNAYYNQGYICMMYENNLDEAIDFFGKAINADESFAKAYYMRGLCYEYKGNKTQAKLDYRKSYDLDPNSQEVQKKLTR
jgi:tetratricopeptide (TPR) repeat protein